MTDLKALKYLVLAPYILKASLLHDLPEYLPETKIDEINLID